MKKKRLLMIGSLGVILLLGLLNPRNSALAEYICYVENNSGDILDLGEICTVEDANDRLPSHPQANWGRFLLVIDSAPAEVDEHGYYTDSWGNKWGRPDEYGRPTDFIANPNRPPYPEILTEPMSAEEYAEFEARMEELAADDSVGIAESRLID
ncbi:MAG: hypothetical protein AAGI69_22400 [Cyanobacteria bacterium P01_H01_bin.21]